MALRRVAVDWEDLEIALTSRGYEWDSYLDLRTGKVRMVQLAGFQEEDDELPQEEIDAGLAGGDLIHIEPLPSSIKYGWMVEFVASVAESRLRNLLEVALNGRGAFRRFKDVIADYPTERARWFACRDQRLGEAMQQWLADHDIETTTPPPKH